ncbi:unnamed protein product, partial [Musa banksii]
KSFGQNETRCLHTITLVVLYIFLAETFMLILMPKDNNSFILEGTPENCQ